MRIFYRCSYNVHIYYKGLLVEVYIFTYVVKGQVNERILRTAADLFYTRGVDIRGTLQIIRG